MSERTDSKGTVHVAGILIAMLVMLDAASGGKLFGTKQAR